LDVSYPISYPLSYTILADIECLWQPEGAGSLKALQHVSVNVVCIEFRIFRPAQIVKSNIVHDIVPDIVYDIEYDRTDVLYDIYIRYRIPINLEDYGFVVSYVYIVPLFYLNCVLKGYPRWTRSLQRNGKAFQSPVEVFWIEVQPIWNTPQELLNWSRINSGELSCRIILVHEITMIVKVHFTIFIAVTGRRTWKTWSCVGTLNHISTSISYTISYTILRTLQKDRLWALDIDTISKKNNRYRLRFSNLTVFGTRC
jgi:hypothetical protein